MHFLKDIHTLKHAYSPTGDLEQSCLVFFPTLPFSFLSFILFNLILYFCFYSPTPACGHTDETPRWEGRLLFLFLLVAHVRGPPSGGGRATEAHLQTQLPLEQMFARTHTHTHGHTHAHTAVKSKPIMSHLFLTSSQSDQVDRRPRGGVVPRHCGHFLTPAAAHKHF